MRVAAEVRKGVFFFVLLMAKACDLRLIELVNDSLHVSVIQNKQRVAGIDKKKKEAWETISIKINAEFGTKLSKKQVEEKWRYLRRTSKSANASFRRSQKETGGGRPPACLSETQLKMVEILGESAGFSGISGAIETEYSKEKESDESVQNSILEYTTHSAQHVAEDEEELGTGKPEAPEATHEQPVQKKRRPTNIRQEDVLNLQYEVLQREMCFYDNRMEVESVKLRVYEKAEKLIDKISHSYDNVNDSK